MHRAIEDCLRRFYFGEEPLGIAFVGSARFGSSFGRSSDELRSLYESADGFVQYHLEGCGISLYASYFGSGRYLVAQFRFQDDYPPPAQPWLAYVRLAVRVSQILENPDDLREPGDAGVAVPRPDRPPLRILSAEAESDGIG